MAEEFIATENGNIKISEDVIIRISAIAAREVEGVFALGSGYGLSDFLGKKAPAKGVKVEIGEDGTVIEIHITVKFGVKINDVAAAIQEAVKSAVESYAGIENAVVNVFVDGIEAEAKTENEEEK